MTKEERDEFRAYIHDRKQKQGGGSGARGDFTHQELLDIGREFLDEYRGPADGV
jgi:hypothetical protein